MTTIPYSVNDGPWQGAAFLQQLVEAKAEYMATTKSKDCPLLKRLLPRIAQEMGRSAEAGTTTFREEVWEILRDASQLRSKGPKPALSDS